MCFAVLCVTEGVKNFEDCGFVWGGRHWGGREGIGMD